MLWAIKILYRFKTNLTKLSKFSQGLLNVKTQPFFWENESLEARRTSGDVPLLSYFVLILSLCTFYWWLQRQDPGQGRPLIWFDLILTFYWFLRQCVCIGDVPPVLLLGQQFSCSKWFPKLSPFSFHTEEFSLLVNKRLEPKHRPGWGETSLPASALLLFGRAHLGQCRRFGRQIARGRSIHFSVA